MSSRASPPRARMPAIAGAMCCLRERRDRAVEDHAEALRIDVPAHDVERVGPGVLTAHLDGGDAGLAGAQARRPRRRRRTARWRRCWPWSACRAGRPGCRARPRPAARRCPAASGQARRDRKPRDAAGAAEAEHRDALDVGAKAHPPGDPRLEAGGRDAGRRHVTTVSTSAAQACRGSSARVAASTKSWHAPSR